MRIGIDGSCLSNRRGFGRFTREIIRALAEREPSHEVTVFVDRPSAEGVLIPERFKRIVVDLTQAPTEAAGASGRRRVRDMLAMGRAVSREGLDLFYFPTTYSFFPIWNTRRVVVTMHDVLALAHPELVFPTASGRISWKIKEYAAVRRADLIVTVSETSRKAILDWFGLAEHRVRAVPEGPDSVFTPRRQDESIPVLNRYGLKPTDRYLLYVGGLSPHKNLPRLVEAFATGAGSTDRLVIVGDFNDVFHTNIPEIREAVRRFSLEDRVSFTGYVHDDDLAYLYSRAYALVQPSLMEGFGLPAVEAMACGTPVISSNAGSLPEVVGDAGIFFDPRDVRGIASVIKEFLEDSDGRHRIASAALERSKRFTWKSAAAELLSLFEEIGATGSRASRRSA